MTAIVLTASEPIPGYRLIGRIGAGGYGEVWKAEAPGELVKAIKFVYGYLDEDRAARELKALNRIKGVRHPFLLSLERIEVVNGQLVIVTELADASLKDRYEVCRKEGLPGIPRAETLGYLRDAAEALDYMSEQFSLQHLDVKPENLLVVGGRVKVADFGLVKNIHDQTASMMGGLTPIYAPPEVFEGAPSRRSDQYSLAIVFQEMLTGVLPFPGKTPAQLAAQHLNAKPRLSALPAADQPIISRALSKNPQDRFSSCRELVDELLAVHRRSQPAAVAEADLRMSQRARLAATEPGPAAAPAEEPEAIRTGEQMLQEAEAAESAAVVDSPAALLDEHVAPLADLPPVELDPATWTPRPTLLIGVGGLGCRVLQRVRRRWDDRQAGVPLEMLAVDTDLRDLLSLSQGDQHGSFKPEEIVSVPLRKPQEYRQERGQLLNWLSRRWLYNIPRSLQTEGMRPLGRLALVDHAHHLWERIQSALKRLIETAEAAHTDPRTPAPAPRVILVAAVSGGTGSGMAPDLCYAIRQLADDLEAPNMELLAYLAHGTTRVPAQQELAAASTLAALTELYQYQRAGFGFPGDRACALRSRSPESPAVNATYLVHLGDDLSPEQYAAAADRFAEALFLDAGSSAGVFFDACRRDPQSTGSETGRLRLRTIGLCQAGFSQDALMDRLTAQLCKSAVLRWSGATSSPAPALRPRTLAASEPEPVRPAANRLEDECQRRASLQAAVWKLEADALARQVEHLLEELIGGSPEAMFRKLVGVGQVTSSGAGSGGASATAAARVGRVQEFFGPRDARGDLAEARRTPLRLALDDRIRERLAELAREMRAWLDAAVDDPALRLEGAQRVARWFLTHLKALAEQFRETRQRLNQDLLQLEPALAQPAPDERSLARSPAARKQAADDDARRVQYCRLRWCDLALAGGQQLVSALQSHVGEFAEGVAEMLRDVRHRAEQYDAQADAVVDPGDDAAGLLAVLRGPVQAELLRHEQELIAQVDAQFVQHAFPALGGMREALLVSGAKRRALHAQLEAAVRQALLEKLQAIDMAQLLLSVPSAEGKSLLQSCLQSAQPRLQDCGGGRRLLWVLPATLLATPATREIIKLTSQTNSRCCPTVLPLDHSDPVFVYEMGNLSLPHAALALLGDRQDWQEVAQRLQSRVDVHWQPLLPSSPARVSVRRPGDAR